MQSGNLQTIVESSHKASMAGNANEEPANKKIKSESMADHTLRTSPTDQISNLPEPIIHLIMSFLPAKDSTRTGALSKRWKHLWGSFPILDFNQTLFSESLPESLPVAQKRDFFLTYLENSIQRRERSIKIDKFRLQALPRCLKSDPMVDRAVNLALEHNPQGLELDFFVKQNAFYKLPQCLYSSKSFTSLKLKGFKLELEDLLSGCPPIEELILQWCEGSTDIRASSAKLKKLELECCSGLNSIELDACNLQSFLYLGESALFFNPCNINLTACTFLKTFSLKNAIVPGQWLEDHISKLVHLENLVLEGCAELTRVKIFHHKLKTLCMLACKNLLEIEIDCPKLCSFMYKGKLARFGLLNSSGSLNAELSLSRDYTIGWFVKLRRLLGLFDHCKVLKIVCSSYKDLILPEELKDGFLPPLHDLKHLKIVILSYTVDCTELVDNLLWLSPHLETLFVASSQEESCIRPRLQLTCQFQYTSLVGKDEDSIFCCGAHPKECWQHCLKRVIIKNFDGSTDDEKKNLLKYFGENAKILESIQDKSKTSKVVEGKCFGHSKILS